MKDFELTKEERENICAVAAKILRALKEERFGPNPKFPGRFSLKEEYKPLQANYLEKGKLFTLVVQEQITGGFIKHYLFRLDLRLNVFTLIASANGSHEVQGCVGSLKALLQLFDITDVSEIESQRVRLLVSIK